MSARRRLLGTGLTLAGGALLGTAAPATGQIGALAAAAAAAGSGGEYALAGAPVFAQSGLVLSDGWSAGAFGVTTSTSYSSDGFDPFEAEYTQSNLALGAFFSLSDDAMIGAVLNPHVSAELSIGGDSESVSGMGNLSVLGKLALARSGPTRLAGTAGVTLPTGDSDIVSGATVFSVGLGVSHRLNATTSLHGGASVGFAGDDGEVEGGSSIGFDGAVVKQLSPNVWLSGEMLGSSSDGAWQVLLAPGARFRAGSRVFIDAGLAFGALSSDQVESMDYGLAIGATLLPRR